MERRQVRFPRVTAAVRKAYAAFLLATGAIALLASALGRLPLPDSPTGEFLHAVIDTGYLFAWVSVYKCLVGVLLLAPRTAPVAVLMALPYSFNILLYVLFLGHELLIPGVLDFLVNAYLIVAHFDWYRSLFLPESMPVSEGEE